MKERINQKYHISEGDFSLYYLPCLISLAKKDKEIVLSYLERMGFNDDLISFIEKKVKN
jgi:hypothetical protein